MAGTIMMINFGGMVELAHHICMSPEEFNCSIEGFVLQTMNRTWARVFGHPKMSGTA